MKLHTIFLEPAHIAKSCLLAGCRGCCLHTTKNAQSSGRALGSGGALGSGAGALGSGAPGSGAGAPGSGARSSVPTKPTYAQLLREWNRASHPNTRSCLAETIHVLYLGLLYNIWDISTNIQSFVKRKDFGFFTHFSVLKVLERIFLSLVRIWLEFYMQWSFISHGFV